MVVASPIPPSCFQEYDSFPPFPKRNSIDPSLIMFGLVPFHSADDSGYFPFPPFHQGEFPLILHRGRLVGLRPFLFSSGRDRSSRGSSLFQSTISVKTLSGPGRRESSDADFLLFSLVESSVILVGDSLGNLSPPCRDVFDMMSFFMSG